MARSAPRPLYIAAFLMEICYGLFLIVASLLAARMIASPLLLGLTGTVHLATRVVINPIFGRLSDRIGRRIPMLSACLLIISAFIILAFPGCLFIFLAYFLSGLGNAIFWPLIEAWIGLESKDEDLLRQLGRFGMAFTSGLSAGCLLGGIFARISAPISIGLGCALAAVVAAMLAAARDRSRDPGIVIPAEAEARIAGTAGERERRLYRTMGRMANFATWVTIGILRFLFPKLILSMDLPQRTVGMVNAMLYACWFLMFVAMTRRRGWAYRSFPLLAMQIVGACAVLLLWLWPGRVVFMLAFALFGFSAGMTYFSSMFYGQNGAVDRGGQSGYHEMILSLGALIGPSIGGAVAEAGTIGSAFLVAAAAIMGAVILEVLLLWRPGARGKA
ncbi:MAG: MFS transporter [Bacteroidota bacterium]